MYVELCRSAIHELFGRDGRSWDSWGDREQGPRCCVCPIFVSSSLRIEDLDDDLMSEDVSPTMKTPGILSGSRTRRVRRDTAVRATDVPKEQTELAWDETEVI